MAVPVGVLQAMNWANALQELITQREQSIPKGFVSANEITRQMKRSLSTTRLKLQELVKLGKVERICLRRRCNKGLAVHTFYKKLK